MRQENPHLALWNIKSLVVRDQLQWGDGGLEFMDLPHQYLRLTLLVGVSLSTPNLGREGITEMLIDHGNGEYSSLGHLQHGSVRAKVGDTVTRGQVIGKVGSSGPSEHPHLHYQLMSGTDLTRRDGLPSQFVNVWLQDTRAREPVQIKVPKRRIQLVAR
jgi:hypothetical protein